MYPFFREHGVTGGPFREPWLYPEPTYGRIVKAIRDRYSMIALWYTHSVYYNMSGRAPVVPLFYEWPEIDDYHKNDLTVYICDSILVSPVSNSGVTKLLVPKPPGNWYAFRNGRPFTQTEVVDVTMEDIPLFIRGGRIVPYYAHPYNTTRLTIKTPMTLIVAVNDTGSAEGTVYLDDGVTFNYTKGVYVHRKIVYDGKTVSWKKVDGKETSVPECLKDAIVNTLVFYEKSGVRRVTGLKYRVAGEWTWHKGRPIIEEKTWNSLDDLAHD
jgi:alpha 1,3-glucosidase